MQAATIPIMIVLVAALGFGFVVGAVWGMRNEGRRRKREMLRAR